MTAAATIAPKRAHWLWESRVAIGALTLLAGPEGLGKSTLVYWIAARISRGELRGELHGSPRDVLINATEDAWAETIVPRLIAAGADLARVWRITAWSGDHTAAGLDLREDLVSLREDVKSVNAALLILDPLLSRLGAGLDSHKDAEVRSALEPLVDMLVEMRMSCIGLIHLNKGASANPLDRVMASKAFTAVARSVCVVVRDPEDDTGARRLFGTPKNNLGQSVGLPTLAFHTENYNVPTDDGPAAVGRIVWDDDSEQSIEQAMSGAAADELPGALKEAVEWLTDVMEAEPRIDSKEVKAAAARSDIALSTLQRARVRLGVTVRRSGHGKTAKSEWIAPDWSENGASK